MWILAVGTILLIHIDCIYSIDSIDSIESIESIRANPLLA